MLYIENINHIITLLNESIYLNNEFFSEDFITNSVKQNKKHTVKVIILYNEISLLRNPFCTYILVNA